jgi:hypothetical protein
MFRRFLKYCTTHFMIRFRYSELNIARPKELGDANEAWEPEGLTPLTHGYVNSDPFLQSLTLGGMCVIAFYGDTKGVANCAPTGSFFSASGSGVTNRRDPAPVVFGFFSSGC